MVRLFTTGGEAQSSPFLRFMARHDTPVWVSAAAGVALTIAGVALWLATGAVSAATDAEAGLGDLRQVAADYILSEGSAARDDAGAAISRIREDIQPTQDLMRWVWRFSPGFAGIPGAEQELLSWASQAERVGKDLEAASALMDSTADLLSVYDSAQTLLGSTGAKSSLKAVALEVQKLESRYKSSASLIGESSRLRRSFGVGLQAPPARRVASLLDDVEGEMSSVSEIGQEVSGLLSNLVDVAEGARPLVDHFAAGAESSPWANDDARAALIALTGQTASTRVRADSVARLVAESGRVGEFVGDLEALGELMDILHVVSKAGLRGLDALQPAIEMIDSADGGLLSSGELLLQALDDFLDRSGGFERSIAELEEARRAIDDLEQPHGDGALQSGLSVISEVVDNLHAGFQLVDSLAPVASTMLGADGPRTYLILGQSADELRGVGGYVSSVWLATFDGGELTAIVYQDSVRVDDWERLALYPKAPPGLDEHMNAWVWLLRDVSWDPDFPTTARSAADLYRLGQRVSVDGVIAINQWSLLELVDSLGSVESPNGGEPLTSRNLLPALEEGTDVHGRAYMDLVLQGLLDKLAKPMSMPEVVRLASGMFSTLEQKDMLLFFEDPQVQAGIALAGWDGGLRREPVDFLGIVDSNVGWSKVDRNIQRDAVYRVDLGRESRPRASLTLAYTNHSGPGSAGCEPQWLNRGSNYSELKNACYWNYLRVYMPQESRLLSSTPLPLPEHTVSVDIGRGSPGQETGSVGSSHGRMVFSGLTSVAAGEVLEVNLVYDLPESIVVRDDEALTYRLLVQKQPGVRNRNLHVEIVMPEGYGLTSSSAMPTETTAELVAFDLALDRDEMLSIELARVTDADG